MTETSITAGQQAPPNPSRRRLLSGFSLGAAAVAGGAVGATATAAGASTGLSTDSLTLEVALIGEMWREAVKANPADDGDFRAPFSVEGWIYPEGTILGDGFVPTAEGSIGRWICRGYTIIDSTRPEPHTSSNQDFILGAITPENLFPEDALHTVGIEGSVIKGAMMHRSVIGGSGQYGGATGTATQEFFATNTSVFADGTNDPGPCFRFIFDLRLPG